MKARTLTKSRCCTRAVRSTLALSSQLQTIFMSLGLQGQTERQLPGSERTYLIKSPIALRRCYRKSGYWLLETMYTMLKSTPSLRSSTYLIPIRHQILVYLYRGFYRLRNNYVPTVSTVIANAILAIVVGSVFYDLPDTTDSMAKRAVLMFFSLMICAFSPAFEVGCLKL